MKKIFLLLVLFTASRLLQAQPVDSIRFFTDEKLITLTLTTDLRGLQLQKGKEQFQEAEVECRMPDSTVINEKIQVAARGNFRRGYCRIPPMLLNFRTPGAPRLRSLGKLKLVLGCGAHADDEALLLKEYLVYKIYNLLEEKSFRVRLLRLNYVDTRNKIKSYSQYAFLIEDDADLAKRTGCKKQKYGQTLTESTNRQLMTKVALFEYMIGNTDWSVPNDHNVKLIFDKKNPSALPYCIPYDFDYCGLVNADYAIPNEIIGTEKVTERVYRGFPRTLEEIQQALEGFRNQREKIENLIMGFDLLNEKRRKEMRDYLDEFWDTIKTESRVKSIFVDNARTS